MLTSSARMRSLNREFRGKDAPTDVLSFPSPAALASRLSGDLAISVDIAGQNAALHGHSLMQEIKVLVLHGVLHLAGYDHESDDGAMARREERLRGVLGLRDGLIARSARQSHSPAKKPSAGRARTQGGSSVKGKSRLKKAPQRQAR